MSGKKVPKQLIQKYNQSVSGFFGEFGSGGNAACLYIQTALTPADLDNVSLVSEIEGSSKWPVRDLFQREVDDDRVSNGIIPYFRDPAKVKFFNPLTLTMLPRDPADPLRVLTSLPNLKHATITEEDQEWTVFENPDYFRFRFLHGMKQYGRLDWNDKRVRIVAIDGQHRLSALKRCFSDPAGAPSDFKDWTIPAVVFGLNRESEKTSGNILDYVRNVFVYINSTARQPNLARTILLSDEDINMVCVQELLQHSHDNDIKDTKKRDPEIVPLLFFDWRGLEKDGERKVVPGTMYKTEDIYDWFRYYILGENFSPEQKTALEIQPTDLQLQSAFSKSQLNIEASKALRTHFNKHVLPGICYFLQCFTPFREYVKGLRDLELNRVIKQKSELSRHAFNDLRFGTNQAGKQLQKQIQNIKGSLVEDIVDLRMKIREPLRRDVGIRGVVYAFGNLKKRFVSLKGTKSDWLSYSKWFTKHLNSIYEDGWLDDTNKKKKKHRLHINYDHNDTVVNYRLDDASKALGPFIELLIMYSAAAKKDFVKKDDADGLWDDLHDTLWNTLRSGYRKYWRPILKDDFPPGPDLNKAVKKKAENYADKHMKKFGEALDAFL